MPTICMKGNSFCDFLVTSLGDKSFQNRVYSFRKHPDRGQNSFHKELTLFFDRHQQQKTTDFIRNWTIHLNQLVDASQYLR